VASVEELIRLRAVLGTFPTSEEEDARLLQGACAKGLCTTLPCPMLENVHRYGGPRTAAARLLPVGRLVGHARSKPAGLRGGSGPVAKARRTVR